MTRVAILCGTGMSTLVDSFSDGTISNETTIRASSPWGDVTVSILNHDHGEIVILDRHHSNDDRRTPPHMIEHRANVHAIASSSPDLIISINSVGTMRDDLPPGQIGICGDVLDLTQRPWTFHSEDAIHADRTSPFDEKAISITHDVLNRSQISTPTELIIAQCVGPQFETPSEIDALTKLGADVVGMTLGPEQRLVAETEIPHIALCCSSNWAAGRDPRGRDTEIDHDEVDEMAGTMRQLISDVVVELLLNY